MDHYGLCEKAINILDDRDPSVLQGLAEYCVDDWSAKIDQLHLPNEKIRNDLAKFVIRLFCK